MHPNQDQQFPGERINARDTFNILCVIVNAYCKCFLPFMRRYFGWQFHGFAGLAALVLIFLTAGFSGSYAIYEFMWIWLVVMLAQRLDSAGQRLKGMLIHSQYDGYPAMGMAVPFVKRESSAKAIEVALCALVGAALVEYDEALGQFVLFGSGALVLKMMLDGWIDGVAQQRMLDAQLESQAMLQRHRVSLRGY
jgi:hypothetical protein